MKIAVVSDDGTTISQHFGRAMFYVVSAVEGGRWSARRSELRQDTTPLPSTSRIRKESITVLTPPHRPSTAPWLTPITDCQVLLAGGMGRGAYESLKSYNIKPIITDVGDIDQAVQLYVDGKLPNLMERLH